MCKTGVLTKPCVKGKAENIWLKTNDWKNIDDVNGAVMKIIDESNAKSLPKTTLEYNSHKANFITRIDKDYGLNHFTMFWFNPDTKYTLDKENLLCIDAINALFEYYVHMEVCLNLMWLYRIREKSESYRYNTADIDDDIISELETIFSSDTHTDEILDNRSGELFVNVSSFLTYADNNEVMYAQNEDKYFDYIHILSLCIDTYKDDLLACLCDNGFMPLHLYDFDYKDIYSNLKICINEIHNGESKGDSKQGIPKYNYIDVISNIVKDEEGNITDEFYNYECRIYHIHVRGDDINKLTTHFDGNPHISYRHKTNKFDQWDDDDIPLIDLFNSENELPVEYDEDIQTKTEQQELYTRAISLIDDRYGFGYRNTVIFCFETTVEVLKLILSSYIIAYNNDDEMLSDYLTYCMDKIGECMENFEEYEQECNDIGQTFNELLFTKEDDRHDEYDEDITSLIAYEAVKILNSHLSRDKAKMIVFNVLNMYLENNDVIYVYDEHEPIIDYERIIDSIDLCEL